MQGFGWMKRLLVIVPLAATVSALGFLAASSIARGAPQVTATVSLRTTKLGAILVGPNGHTLYLFAKDRSGKSACAGSCATYWPPLLSRKPTAGKGVKASLLGTTMRSNGSLQVTYAKHPLYGFALDKQAGQTNGEGNLAFGAKWWAVSASGTPVLKAQSGGTPTPTTTTPTTTYGGYGP